MFPTQILWFPVCCSAATHVEFWTLPATELLNFTQVLYYLKKLEDVLSREKFTRRLAAANVTVQDLVSGYSALATVIETEPIEPVILVDPDDDAVLACALFAEAEIIVSGDSDLLDLKQHQEIRILTATEFLAELAL